MSPKEALVKDGFPVKSGRGRLSREATERCRELAAKGWDIQGYVVSRTAPIDTNTSSPVITKVNKVRTGNVKEIAELPPIRYDERDGWYAISDIPNDFGESRFSVREVCRTCGNSLSYHWCNSPFTRGVPVRLVQ